MDGASRALGREISQKQVDRGFAGSMLVNPREEIAVAQYVAYVLVDAQVCSSPISDLERE
jgi:hypothetical protein